MSTRHPPPTVSSPLTPSRWHSSSRSSSVSAASRAVSAPTRPPRAACRLSACRSRARPYRGGAACFRGPAREFTPRLAATRRALWSGRACRSATRVCCAPGCMGEQGPGEGAGLPGRVGRALGTNAWPRANKVYLGVYPRVVWCGVLGRPSLRQRSFFARGVRAGPITAHLRRAWSKSRVKAVKRETLSRLAGWRAWRLRAVLSHFTRHWCCCVKGTPYIVRPCPWDVATGVSLIGGPHVRLYVQLSGLTSLVML